MTSLMTLSSTLIKHLFHKYPRESTHSTLKMLIKDVAHKRQITAILAISMERTGIGTGTGITCKKIPNIRTGITCKKIPL